MSENKSGGKSDPVRGTISVEVEFRFPDGSNPEGVLADLGVDIEHWLHDHPQVEMAFVSHSEVSSRDE